MELNILKRIGLCLCILSPGFIMADEIKVDIELSKLTKMENTISELEIQNKACGDSILLYKAEIAKKDREIDELKKGNLKITELSDTVAWLKKEINALKEEQSSFDMVRLRYANGRLSLPYDKEKVTEAIEMFNGITDSKLKETYNEVLISLNEYQTTLPEVKTLVESLSYPGPKPSKFDGDKIEAWKRESKRKITGSNFMQKHTKRDYKINYLYDIVTEAQSRIEKANYEDMPSFTDLIIRLEK